MKSVVTLAKDADVQHVRQELEGLGLWTAVVRDDNQQAHALTVSSHSRSVSSATLRQVAGVLAVLETASPHPRVDAQSGKGVDVAGGCIGGGGAPVLIAGPCSAESADQVGETAAVVASAGALILRGGAYKPRTSPYAFRGHGARALVWLRDAADRHGLKLVTEVLSEEHVDPVSDVADLLQIGSRNMQNFSLLEAVGRVGKPVLLKRGMAATVHDWMMSAEHLLVAGASGVVFCERGIVGFDPSTRNLLDLAAVALLKHVHDQPVLVDPSHASGRRDLIPILSKSALAAGADGIVVEVHPNASQALSDAAQALAPAEFSRLSRDCGWQPGGSDRV